MSLTIQNYEITLKVHLQVPASVEVLGELTDSELGDWAKEGAEILAGLVTDELGVIYREFGALLEVKSATGIPV